MEVNGAVSFLIRENTFLKRCCPDFLIKYQYRRMLDKFMPTLMKTDVEGKYEPINSHCPMVKCGACHSLLTPVPVCARRSHQYKKHYSFGSTINYSAVGYNDAPISEENIVATYLHHQSHSAGSQPFTAHGIRTFEIN